VLASRLAELRRNAGLSQQQLSNAAGVAIKTISEIETGVQTNPTLSTLNGLTRALGVTVDDLLTDPEAVATFP
jgi:transcriptional regulator with XRE-family HTH domain